MSGLNALEDDIKFKVSQAFLGEALTAPIDLPTALAVLPEEISTQITAFDFVGPASAKNYRILVDLSEGCMGAFACDFFSYGQIIGRYHLDQYVSDAATQLNELAAFRNTQSAKIERVILDGAVEAYYIPRVCGASCAPEKLVWQTGDRFHELTSDVFPSPNENRDFLVGLYTGLEIIK